MNIPSLKFVDNKSDTLDILLHGGKGGMNQSLNLKIFDASVYQCHSVVSFNFSFFERGEEQSSGPELKEELETLQSVLDKCKAKEYQYIRLVGKSLGAIIASYYLKSLSTEVRSKYSIVVLGYVTGSIDLKSFPGKINIIQGEKDKFGNIEVVKNDLKDAVSKNINYFEIKEADHSYRNELKEPIFEDEVIDIFKKLK
jgi:predicted alpha/beta-hydrolase family hydrolase